ncbi:uncharacterized protein LOC117794204 [Drosophila innubila]|uniref:uncharacterized protein LOC117794204 n=1 Tax=Drosophila innubila TaxID=198719 RepID=UPI00148E8CBF|nr:uncharacterized protein LOC117794204 [Drosophila innubila]
MFPWKSTPSSSNSLGEEETELDVEQIARELQEMTLYLDEMELKLQTGVPACPRRESADALLELHGSRNGNIRKLQNNSHKLQHQLEELFDCSKSAKKSMIDLHHSLWNLEKKISIAHHQTEAIESMKLHMDLEGVRCLQRYKYLNNVFFNWTECYEGAKEMKRIFNGRVNRMYSKAAYHKEKRKILEELEKTEITCASTNNELIQQCKQLKCWVYGFIESEPLWNSMVSLVTIKAIKDELDEKLRFRRSSLSQVHSSVSFSTGRYDRMLSMIKQMSFLNLDPKI